MTIKERFIDANVAQRIADAELFVDEAGTVQFVLSHTPTVDAVRVVRCADCIWCKKPTDKQKEKYGLLDEALLCKFWKDKKGRWPFDYCSYGTRRTELL